MKSAVLLARILVLATIFTSFPACSQSSDTAAQKGRVTSSGPAGVFFMTRYWSYTHTLEKAMWFFAPDGIVYANLENGVTPADLAAHKGLKGTMKFSGGKIAITWGDGKTENGDFEPDKGGPGFAWDMGLFSPADPVTNPAQVIGKWGGGEYLSHGGNTVATGHDIEFRADGTFTRESIALVQGEIRDGKNQQLSKTQRDVAQSASSGTSTGTWKTDGYTLVLTSGGTTERKMAFPWKDDDKLPSNNRLYLGGLMLKRQ